MQQTNPRWLLQKVPSDLKAQIHYLSARGYQILSQTSTTAQLNRKKSFSCLIATLSFFFFGIGFFIYLFYYLAKKDDSIYLDTEQQPTKKELEVETEKLQNRPWYQRHPVLTICGAFLVFTVFMAIMGSLGGSSNNAGSASSTAEQTAAKIIPYEIVARWTIPNGGEGKIIVISKDHLNETDMEALGQKLKSVVSGDRNAFISIFTDKQAAALRDKVISDKATGKEADLYDKNYVGEYTKNGNSGFHQFKIYFDGIMGTSTKTIEY